MTQDPEVREEMLDVEPAHLWAKIKAQCLNINPYIGVGDDGKTTVKCPRCGEVALDMEYIKLSVEPHAMEWASVIRKCPHCKHLFAFVE